MSKTSTYKNPSYCLSFGVDDVVFIDLEALIHKEGEQFRLEIVKSQLACTQMEFACYLLTKMTADGLREMNERLLEALTVELTPILFQLFYSGEVPDYVQPN